METDSGSARLAVVIPARMASTRFPGKPLVDLAGKPMLRWVYEACVASGVTSTIVVATPDREIAAAAEAFGARAVLTRADHPSGTDRIAEVAESVVAEAYLNVQGDEPLLDPENLRRCAALAETAEVGSLWVPAADSEASDPAVVKVATDLDGFALLFSRFAIPYPRNPGSGPLKKHLGLYLYRRAALMAFRGWAPSELELAEGLEQLRFLERGVRIRMAEGVPSGPAVDLPEHAEAVRSALARRATGSSESGVH